MEGAISKGEVIVLNFPFSDLSAAKKRPALVLANIPGQDIIVCQITSKIFSDKFSISLSGSDFKTGGLNKESRIRPNKLFTADKRLIAYSAGKVSSCKINSAVQQVIRILSS